MPSEAMRDREIIFEFFQQGDYLRVVAIDAATGIEITTFGPKSAAQRDLQQLAMAKLQRALIKAGHIRDQQKPRPQGPGLKL